MKRLPLIACIMLTIVPTRSWTQAENDYLFRNPALTTEERVKDLLSRLTLEEKVQLMKHDALAIPRLGIPAYNWWNEALHGVARTGES